jgi:hypothetical protein
MRMLLRDAIILAKRKYGYNEFNTGAYISGYGRRVRAKDVDRCIKPQNGIPINERKV